MACTTAIHTRPNEPAKAFMIVDYSYECIKDIWFWGIAGWTLLFGAGYPCPLSQQPPLIAAPCLAPFDSPPCL